MRQLIPSSREILIFAVTALVGAFAVTTLRSSAHDLGLSVVAMPVFVFAAVMGLRRNWARAGDEESM
jgi:hypothetical protein